MDTVFIGRLCTPVAAHSTESGKTAFRFGVVNGRKAGNCVAWQHMLDDGLSVDRLMKGRVDEEVTLKGFWAKREMNKKKDRNLFKPEGEPAGSDAEKEFVVKWFRFAADKAAGRTFSERVRELVTEEQAREYYQEKLKAGYVRVKTFGDNIPIFAKKDECVRHAGAWKRKIDFVMELLGPVLVVAELKDFQISERRKQGQLTRALRPHWVQAYKDKLDELVETARQFELHPPVQSQVFMKGE